MTFLAWFIGLPLGILIWCYALATVVNMVDDFGEDAVVVYLKVKEKLFGGRIEPNE
jgi:hypothetical protein